MGVSSINVFLSVNGAHMQVATKAVFTHLLQIKKARSYQTVIFAMGSRGTQGKRTKMLTLPLCDQNNASRLAHHSTNDDGAFVSDVVRKVTGRRLGGNGRGSTAGGTTGMKEQQ